MPTEINNIELRSEEVQEILGHIPSRIIRYGIIVVLSIVLVLFAGSFFFKYPDIITANVEVLTQNPPAEVTANISGDISSIFVADSQFVETGHVLGIIKNSADYSHVSFLNNHLIDIERELLNPSLFEFLPDTLQLGDVQSAYSTFYKASQEYKQFIKLDYHQKKIQALGLKQKELLKYAAIMTEQAKLRGDEYELVENQYKRDSQLFAKEVISVADLEKSKKALIQNGMSVQTAKSTVVNTQIQLQELKQQIVEYEQEEIKQANNYKQALNEHYRNLDSRVAGWFNQYVLVAPISGNVAFNKVWNENQFVEASSQVFAIVPQYKQKIIGRVTLTSKGAGKVKRGQSVNLKFNNFPYQEFGMVQAKVSTISLVPQNDEYILELNLPDSLVTNYNIVLPFTQKMTGTAEIITEDLPLITRLFNPLKAIFKKHWS